MRLSKIKLSGFKSFVDPTTIAFPGNLMGIVGPNGCGKSNIIDAIRWVLGERSAKTLRGDSMADVIFNGSSVRKPVGRASVELIFNNSDGTLSGPYAGYAEVAVRRVMSRDGASQYFLNNSRCRRKDITHLLLGTGLGAQGYSIIEQGMISRLVEARPDELRAFLEEAAGISKYKERRRETEQRIRRTRENLDRLSDLREEVGKQLNHLQRQARSAERFKTLKAEQRRMGAEWLALRLSALRDDMRKRKSLRDERQTDVDAAVARQRSTETEIEELRLEWTERNDQCGEIQGQSLQVAAEIARLEEAIEHRKKLAQQRKEEVAAIDEQLAALTADIDADQGKIRRIDRLLEELGRGLEQARLDHRAALDNLRRAERSVEESRERWGCVIEALAEAERKEQMETQRLEDLRAQRERLEEEQERLGVEQADSSTSQLRDRVNELAEEERILGPACEEASAALRGLWEQTRTLREEESAISRRLDQARRELHEHRGRMTSLEALQEAAAAPASDDVGDWLESRKLSSSPRYAEGLTVEAGWERAVETVLGDYLQAVCVDSIDDAAVSLSELAAGDLALWDQGAVENASPRGRGRTLDRYVEGPGVEGLLAGVYAAHSVADALAVRRRLKPRESVVTRDGVWMGPSWLRISRSDRPQAGVLARGEEIKRLRGDIASRVQRVRELESAVGDARRRVEQLEATRAKAQSDADRRRQRYADVSSRLEADRSRLDELQARDQAMARRTEAVGEELRGLRAGRLETESALEAARARCAELKDSRVRLDSGREDRRRRLVEARAGEEKNRAAEQKISMRMESEKSSRESAASTLQRVCAQQDRLSDRRRELRSQLQAAVEPAAQEAHALGEQLEERLDAQERLVVARGAVEDVDQRLSAAKHLRSQQEQRVEAAREALEKVQLDVRECEVRMEAVVEELAKTGFEADELLEALDEDAAVPVWEEKLKKLERQIQRLGAINLAAIDEYHRQSERKQHLDAQFADLSKALDTLERAIHKIDRETRTRFEETFAAANAGLSRLFPRLYGGGHAYLELDGDDLLSSGVTVMASPPGKRISTIHLLSGGEKALTAVALVFSIFELNPAPFCLLDEVDAPLDDANIGRFSEIVNEMSQRVQFVLITHNKTTMESMQQLTGVTMSEPGVSRLVAVDIDEAVQLAAM